MYDEWKEKIGSLALFVKWVSQFKGKVQWKKLEGINCKLGKKKKKKIFSTKTKQFGS